MSTVTSLAPHASRQNQRRADTAQAHFDFHLPRPPQQELRQVLWMCSTSMCCQAKYPGGVTRNN